MKKIVEPKPLGASRKVVDEFAEEFADAMGFAPGALIEGLVSKLSGRVVYDDEITSGDTCGAIQARALDDFTIYLSTFTSPLRDRFTIAHELGHLFLHLSPIQKEDPEAEMFATRAVKVRDDTWQRAEWEANWFAAGLLMPKTKFIDASKTMTDDQLSQYFGMSKLSVQARKNTLDQ